MWHGSSSLRTSVSTLVTITLAPANSTRSQSELKALTFQGDPDARKLLDAIEHFKEKQGAIDKTAPVTFLDPTEVAAVNKDSKFRVSLYKALLFLHVQSAIKSGGLNLEHSYKYRPLDDYLIDRARWQRDKQQLIERVGLEAFVDPHKVLDKLDEALHRQYLISNGNIIEGKNPFIKFGKNGLERRPEIRGARRFPERPADRESAYVIDGLMHNEVVKSDIHSTDTFGFSELVFGVSHLLGFSYAPRFKNLKRQRLYIFKSRRGLDRSAWKIKPRVISMTSSPSSIGMIFCA